MRKEIICIILIFILIDASSLFAEKFSVSGGFVAGIMPSMGGNLDSSSHELYCDSPSGTTYSGTGVDGINRKMDGYSTSNIDRLTGVFGGIEIKAIFFDYYLLRLGANYGMSIIGGSGKTVFYSAADADYFLLKCEYSFKEYDIPVTLGVSIPFWKDAKISISCGAAFASAEYENKFVSEVYGERKGSFSGWGIPLVVLVQGEYFIMERFALTSAITYYRGSSKVVRDSLDDDGDVDFASIDFTGYRFNLGVSYYFYYK